MAQDPYASLSARERQVMDAVYELGEATAIDVRGRMPDPPTDATVRSVLRVLEEKGWLRHRRESGRYVYAPVHARGKLRQRLLGHVLNTFFDGSPAEVVAALLDRRKSLDDEERARLRELLAEIAAEEKR